MRIQSCTEIIEAMPLAEYVRRGQRVRREADFSTEKMDAVLMRRFAAEPNAVQCSPVSLRRLCYKVFLLHPEAEYAELMLYFIRTEQDGAQRSALVRSYLQNEQYSVSSGLLEAFTHDKYWRVRLDAYEYRMKQQGSRNGLEALLLSSSYPIREFAAYYLEKDGFDNIRYCKRVYPGETGDASQRDYSGKEKLMLAYTEKHTY